MRRRVEQMKAEEVLGSLILGGVVRGDMLVSSLARRACFDFPLARRASIRKTDFLVGASGLWGFLGWRRSLRGSLGMFLA